MESSSAFIAAHPVMGLALLIAIAPAMAWLLLLPSAAAEPAARRWPRRTWLRPALLLVCIGTLFALWGAMGADHGLSRIDTLLATSLRHSSTAETLRGFSWLTRLGDFWTLMMLGTVVAGVLLWRRRRFDALWWVVAVGGNGLLIRALKAVVQRERPLHAHGWVVEHGWSFPSGHASGALALYGMLAYLLMRHLPCRWHLPLLATAIALILAIGYSRIVLHVHYLSDVLAGYVSALAWLLACAAAADAIRTAASRRDAQLM